MNTTASKNVIITTTGIGIKTALQQNINSIRTTCLDTKVENMEKNLLVYNNHTIHLQQSVDITLNHIQTLSSTVEKLTKTLRELVDHVNEITEKVQVLEEAADLKAKMYLEKNIKDL